MAATRRKRISGFTLIEVIIVISIMAILAAIALPSYSRMIQQHNVATVARDFENSLKLAQRHAYVSNRPVTVCPVLNVSAAPPLECAKWSDLSAASDDANPGWVVFGDSLGVIEGTVEARETVFDRSFFDRTKASMTWTNNKRPRITLTPRNTSGTAGTMRVSVPLEGAELPKWQSSNPPKLSEKYSEVRVGVSSLGKITYEK